MTSFMTFIFQKSIVLTGIDRVVFTIFQILFAISTLAPVAITIYRDIRIMLLRAQHKIRIETKKR